MSFKEFKEKCYFNKKDRDFFMDRNKIFRVVIQHRKNLGFYSKSDNMFRLSIYRWDKVLKNRNVSNVFNSDWIKCEDLETGIKFIYNYYKNN